MMGGVQKTTDFLDKSTWTLATILIVLILMSSLSFTGALNDNESKIIDQTEAAAPKAAAPAAAKPEATPATEAAKTETPATTEAPATEPAKK
jgi:preprotein translocase subunit SecG